MSKPLLLFGSRGQLGFELTRTLSVLGEVVAVGQPECDICDEAALRALIRAVAPSAIVNAAAYTAVDKAETDLTLASRVNAQAPAIMAQEAERLGVPLVHYSTDYVYDGRAAGAYAESQVPAPLSVYGRTKLAGDVAIGASGCAHVIFRTTWVYGHHGNNFVKTMLRLARSREELKVVADQIGAPTWSRELATATAATIRQLARDPAAWRAVSGIYHLSAGGQTTWFDFADEIIAQGRAAGVLGKPPTLLATTTQAYGAPAPRPLNSVLSNEKVAKTFGIRLPDWRTSFLQMFHEHPATLIG